MKKVLTVCIMIISIYASEDNSTSIDQNKTWSTAITGGWSSVQSEVKLYNEYKLSQHVGLIGVAGIRFFNFEGFKIYGYGLSLSAIYYLNKNAYSFEGFHTSLGAGVSYFYPGIDLYEGYYSSEYTKIGYGWHFFDHHLLIKLGIGLSFDNISQWSIPHDLTIAYIF